MKKRLNKSSRKNKRAIIKHIRKKVIKKVIKKSKEKNQKKKITRVQTGIKNLDELIEGGFIKNSTNLLVGGSGTGKSTLSTEFLIGGIKRGEKCLYVTFEEKKDRFFTNMKRLGYDLELYEKKGLFTFLEYTPAKVKTMLEEGGGEIESVIIKKKVTRMVIDSITSFELLFKEELEKREASLSLFNMISKWNCTSFLTFEGKPLKESNETSRTLEFEADSIILLYYIRDKKSRKRYLEILKMRGTDHSKDVHEFQIEKTGIVIKKAPENKPPENI
ncbi:MAG: ATPase domain-containing protein [Candidatus Pacearchaeota archaeon]|nr:ATPase domain-containing protein [Candidatus Pacearchaeota archaeon]